MKRITILATAFGLLGVACAGQQTTEPAAAPVPNETAAQQATTTPAAEGEALCEGFGPQTPRDITKTAGANTVTFPLAPPPSELNLCNIHTHTNAEHSGPGFNVFVGDDKHGGFACNDHDSLTEAQRSEPTGIEPAFGHVKPGDTIEVHWVYSSCDVAPGEGLGSCLKDDCKDPLLRVETQVFLVVNDPKALDFTTFDYAGPPGEGRHQPRALPSGTGDPVIFRGSTTGPSYTQSTCSPVKVTWSVRPQCARVDISSLHRWSASGNVFEETESHGVRQLVTAPELLAPIEGS